jgi:hypothetical protein
MTALKVLFTQIILINRNIGWLRPECGKPGTKTEL